jgi:hypothetical protein
MGCGEAMFGSLWIPQVAELRHQFDAALTCSYQQYRGQGLPLSTWWSHFRNVAHYILDCHQFDKVCAEEDSFLKVAPGLRNLCASSKTGQAIFSSSLTKVVEEEMAQLLKAELEAITGEVTLHKLAEVYQRMHKHMVEKGAEHFMGTTRDVAVTYRGITANIRCSSFDEEMRVRATALIKSQCAAAGLLPAMCFEEDDRVFEKDAGSDKQITAEALGAIQN